MIEEKANGKTEPIASESLVAMCQFKCGNCENQMVARVPPMRVFNFPESSGVIIAHERMAKCPNCGTVYVPLVGKVTEKGEIQLVWKPIPTKESAIMAPSFKDVEAVNKTKKM